MYNSIIQIISQSNWHTFEIYLMDTLKKKEIFASKCYMWHLLIITKFNLILTEYINFCEIYFINCKK